MKSLGVAQEGRTNPYCESESRDGRDPDFDLVANNLARYRWYGPTLSRDEERDLIRRAQGGDEQAKDRLHRSFARTILKIAGKYYGPTRDVLTAAGHLGLAEAIGRFDLSRSNGLRAYAESWIRKFIGAEAVCGSRSGAAGETRVDRVLNSHRYLIDNPSVPNPVERLAKMAGCIPLESRRSNCRL